jgi:hypothetical protein
MRGNTDFGLLRAKVRIDFNQRYLFLVSPPAAGSRHCETKEKVKTDLCSIA